MYIMTFLFMKIVFTIANSTDRDEILPYAAFHRGLSQCLPKYMFEALECFLGKQGRWPKN